MVGILIFTQQSVLDHKLKDGKKSKGCYCYWEMARMPKKEITRLYFAVKGQVKGYFEIHLNAGVELRFFSESWHPIKLGEDLKPSQGWRYYCNCPVCGKDAEYISETDVGSTQKSCEPCGWWICI